MIDSPKEKAEKLKVIRKLMTKWLRVQSTEQKATIVLSKNPELKLQKKNWHPGKEHEQ
jgi:hypothetical protein